MDFHVENEDFGLLIKVEEEYKENTADTNSETTHLDDDDFGLLIKVKEEYNTSELTCETSRKKKRSLKTTIAQFKKLNEFMQSHLDFNKGNMCNSAENQKLAKDWEKLTAELNAIGPPYRNSMQWRKVWSDYKGNRKRKAPTAKINVIPSKANVESITNVESEFTTEFNEKFCQNNYLPIAQHSEQPSICIKEIEATSSANCHGDKDNANFHLEILKKFDKVVEQLIKTNSELQQLNEFLKVKFADNRNV